MVNFQACWYYGRSDITKPAIFSRCFHYQFSIWCQVSDAYIARWIAEQRYLSVSNTSLAQKYFEFTLEVFHFGRQVRIASSCGHATWYLSHFKANRQRQQHSSMHLTWIPFVVYKPVPFYSISIFHTRWVIEEENELSYIYILQYEFDRRFREHGAGNGGKESGIWPNFIAFFNGTPIASVNIRNSTPIHLVK